MQSNALWFAFSGTNSEQVLKLVKSSELTKCYISSSHSGIDNIIATIKKYQPTGVLGLGLYTGRDQDELRIETTAKNRFRTGIIAPQEIIRLNNYISTNSKHLRLAEGMGNSWCNLVSYRISEYFPAMKFSFVHVPRDFDISLAASLLQPLLQ